MSEGRNSQGDLPGEGRPRPGPSRLGGEFKERHSRSGDKDSGAGMRQLRERKAARTRGALGSETPKFQPCLHLTAAGGTWLRSTGSP